MNYKETCEFLFSRLPMYQRIGKAAYKANLGTTMAIDNYFNHPHNNFISIHIAGTNGKGSVAHSLSAILQQEGYKTALYTSPHLIDFRERIKINGVCIPEHEVEEFVAKHYDNLAKFEPSFFELTVAMAFDYFSNEKVDIAIIETGMGGRLDSTNIISPKLSIITNISKDHTQFLGDSLAKIAVEKAGIIKTSTPVVIGESNEETNETFINYSQRLNAPVYFADQYYLIDYSTLSLSHKQVFQVYSNEKLVYPDLELDLLGLYQKQNLITILKSIDVIRELGISVSKSSVYGGLGDVSKLSGLLGRWQTLGNNPRIVCDTGHNEAGISNIVNQIQNIAYKNLHIVFGMVNDKNIDTVLSLLPKNAIYYFCKSSVPRSLDENILKEKAEKFKLIGKSYPSVEEALQNAKENADKDDFIFVGGSTFVVADCLMSEQMK